MMNKLTLGIFLMLINSAVFATNAEFNGTVKGFYVNSNGEVLVNIRNSASVPDCNNSSWPFAFNVNDISAKYWLSMLLASKTTEDLIRVGYAPSTVGSCSVNYFYYWD